MIVTLIEALWDRPVRSWNDPKGVFFNVGNGSINRTAEGYVLTNRIQNHYTSLGRHHPSQKEKIQTISYVQWINMDMDLHIVGSHLIDQSLLYQKSVRPVDRQLIIGLEDMRLIWCWDRWGFVASTGHFDDWDAHQFWGQCFGLLSDDTTKVVEVNPLRYKNRRLMEKNWLPFIHRGYINLLYESNPMTILQVSGVPVYIGEKNDLPTFRGSGSPIPWGDRYLYTVHEQGVLWGELPLTDQYFYSHRFVEMDHSYQITRISPLFNFREEGVEYTCGHCLSHDGKTLLIPYSSANGTDSNLMGVAVETVEKMLNV